VNNYELYLAMSSSQQEPTVLSPSISNSYTLNEVLKKSKLQVFPMLVLQYLFFY